MKVLVVEDEHKIANSIKKGLEQESYIVDVAYDGIAGYDLAVSEEYDVIVLDLMLPKKDGISISSELRKEGIHTPILMLTAKGELADKIEGFKNGADDYLLKTDGTVWVANQTPNAGGPLFTQVQGGPAELPVPMSDIVNWEYYVLIDKSGNYWYFDYKESYNDRKWINFGPLP